MKDGTPKATNLEATDYRRSFPSTCSAKYERALMLAVRTLHLYADPESYHAVAMFCDRPSGWFADDVGKVDHPHYDRKMPGKEARRTLEKIRRLISPNDVR